MNKKIEDKVLEELEFQKRNLHPQTKKMIEIIARRTIDLTLQEVEKIIENGIKKINKIIDDLEDENEYGGSEDEDGALIPAIIDFDELRKELKQLKNKIQ